MQTRVKSLIEVTVSTLIGLIVSLATQLVVFPIYGMEVTLNQNLQITAIFTVVSVARSYVVRRLFNKVKNNPTTCFNCKSKVNMITTGEMCPVCYCEN